MQQQTHRPGPLHQTNKPHKTPRHSRKASATSEIKNKVVSRSSSLSSSRSLARTERLNQAHQNRKLKWEKAISNKRSIGAGSQAPISVGILGSATNFLKGLQDDGDSLSIKQINERSLYVLSSRLKMRFKLITLNHENFDETIDLVKTIDLIFLVHSPDDIEQDNYIKAFDILQVVYIHCLPTIIHVIDGFGRNNGSLSGLKRKLKLKVGDDKLHSIENHQDYAQLFHIAGSSRRQKSTFKDARPIVSSDNMSVIDGRLAITGFVRNKTLNPNDLVHIPGYDDYQIHKIEIIPDVVSLRPQSVEGDQVVQTLVPDLMKQETLEQEHELDPMEGEQNWPIAEDADDDELEQEDRDDQLEEQDDPMDQDEQDNQQLEGQHEEEHGEAAVEEEDDNDYEDVEMDQDEIDGDTNARVRYARYRGLKSFRTSVWDPQENLPTDYSRIYQFQNFQQTKRRIMSEFESRSGANPGLYVRVHLSNVPQEAMEKLLAKPLPPSLIGLLKYERKITVMNLLIKRLPDVRDPIKSKEELVFYVGFRKFKARPLFTSNTISSKFKYERFLKNDVTMVATLYAPITFPPAPVLVFRNGELVASGSVLDSNPNRLIIKRIRLSGHPFKIHSKTAVIRSMFYNSDDVLYFKPVELITKHGRRGHISEPLGTHGHMKCSFDKKIRSDDRVFMNLYKRVFPKWTYSPVYE
uniref:Pre-rRNA-processing protein TSR1 homolog n=1 Tax=Aceria tosichella TaxID=561515 RepID=A0A6G1SJL1_9ACAR